MVSKLVHLFLLLFLQKDICMPLREYKHKHFVSMCKHILVLMMGRYMELEVVGVGAGKLMLER